MIFGGKAVREVGPDEIEALVERREPESQWLEFKQEPWSTTSSGHSERLQDVVAMANGGGGYILLGINEDENGRACEIVDVANAAQQANSIIDAVTSGTDPRMSGIQATDIETVDGSVVVIRVPPASPLYAVLRDQRPDYWCRYEKIKKRMSHEEIRAAFQGTENGAGPAYAEASGRAVAEATLPLDAWQFRNMTDLAFDHEIGQNPYYRATLTPFDLRRSIKFSHELRALLAKPKPTRRAGHHIWELDVVQSENALVGTNRSRGHQVVLQRNGFIEFRYPFVAEIYEVQLEGRRGPINPYPLIELPVSFHRHVLSVYQMLDIAGPGVARHSYHNIRELRLTPKVPENDHWARGHAGAHFSGHDVYVPDVGDFDPDALVYDLMTEFYAAFGFGEDDIPLFDDNHHFAP